MMVSSIAKAFVIPIIAVAIIAAATAMWSETLKTNAVIDTGEVDWEFVNGSLILLDACGLPPGYGSSGGYDWNASYYPDSRGTQLDKDVGCTEAVFIDSDGDGDYDTLNITIHNAYPWYYTHVAFRVVNSGTVPIKIWRVLIDGQAYYYLNEHELQQGVEIDLSNDGVPDITIWWGDNFGVQLEPGDSADISLYITVLQGAPENSTLTFTVQLQAIQWNEYTPGPIGG